MLGKSILVTDKQNILGKSILATDNHYTCRVKAIARHADQITAHQQKILNSPS